MAPANERLIGPEGSLPAPLWRVLQKELPSLDRTSQLVFQRAAGPQLLVTVLLEDGPYAFVLGPIEGLIGVSQRRDYVIGVSWKKCSASPESFLFKTSLVDTGMIDGVRAVERIGTEFAWSSGSFRIQSEYIATRVKRDNGDNLSFQGGYVYAAWVVNGSGPKYVLEAKTATEIGVFKRVEPASHQRVSRGGMGVFELALRYSAIDLTSRDVRGGRQHDLTVALNWYPEPFIRVMANFIHASADQTTTIVTGQPATANIGQLRVQLAF